MSELETFRDKWIEEILIELSLTPTQKAEKLANLKHTLWKLAGFKTPSPERDAYMSAREAAFVTILIRPT
jgi:hypothetical protein